MRKNASTANGANTSVRVARVVDIPVLVALERQFDHDERQLVLKENRALKPLLRITNARFSAQRMRGWIRAGNSRVLIAEVNGKPCGFSVAWIETSPSIYRPKRY